MGESRVESDRRLQPPTASNLTTPKPLCWLRPSSAADKNNDSFIELESADYSREA
jgi:hypothetical protein